MSLTFARGTRDGASTARATTSTFSVSLERARSFGMALIGIQFLGMLAFSTIQYQRYGLSNDFGGFAQAWQSIGHGDLNPWVSVFGVRFLQNNLDLAMYPLALLGRAVPNPIILLWAQDAIVAAAGAVTVQWATEIFRRRELERSLYPAVVLVGTSVALAFNPWSWETIAFPLHFEPFAALFALLTARDLWLGRTTRLWLWVPLAIGAEALGSLYILAVGIAGVLAGRATRPVGAWLTVVGGVGLAAVVGFGVVGRNQATILQTYGYLLPPGRAHVDLMTLAIGVASHPIAAATVFSSHVAFCIGYLLAGGILGIATPWGATVVVFVLLPNALSSELPFISFTGAFGNWPIEPILTIGTVMVLAGASGGTNGAIGAAVRLRRRGVRAVTVVLLGADLTLALFALARIPPAWILNRPASRSLAIFDRRIPVDAEVIGEQNIVGRFSSGRDAYSLSSPTQTFPVDAREIVLLLMPGLVSRDRAIATATKRRFGATDLMVGGGIEALLWTSSARSVTIEG